jgi:hypothetical protein
MSRNRLAPVLTEASSWTSDRPTHRRAFLRASVSSDRSAQRGSRFVGEGEDPDKEGFLVASSTVRFLGKKAR